MWAQAWDNIFDLVKPYPDAVETNLTEILLENNFTSIKMFKVCLFSSSLLGIFRSLFENVSNQRKPRNFSPP